MCSSNKEEKFLSPKKVKSTHEISEFNILDLPIEIILPENDYKHNINGEKLNPRQELFNRQ